MAIDGQVLLFADTETADINPPTLLQLGYMLVQVDSSHPNGYRNIRTVSTVLNQGPDIKINPYAFKVHGITAEFSNKFGLSIVDVLNCFSFDLSFANVLLFHNSAFDMRVLKTAATNAKLPNLIKQLDSVETFCTMKATKGFCGLLDKRGLPKNPKLSELYYEIYGRLPDDQHDALGDVRATVCCYFDLPEELQWNG